MNIPFRSGESYVNGKPYTIAPPTTVAAPVKVEYECTCRRHGKCPVCLGLLR